MAHYSVKGKSDMPHQMEWLIPNQLIYIYTQGHMTVAETTEVLEKTFDMAMSPEAVEQGRLIHVISDTTDVTKNDMGIGDYRRIFAERKDEAERPGWTVTITPSSMERFFGSIALQFLGLRGRQVANIEDALKFLSTSDDSLPTYDELMAMYRETHVQMLNQMAT